jgi:hypothetical protein
MQLTMWSLLQTAKTWHYVTTVFIANTWHKQLISAPLPGKGYNGTLSHLLANCMYQECNPMVYKKPVLTVIPWLADDQVHVKRYSCPCV